MLARLNLLNADGKSSYPTGPYVEGQTHCSHIMLAVNGMSCILGPSGRTRIWGGSLVNFTPNARPPSMLSMLA